MLINFSTAAVRLRRCVSVRASPASNSSHSRMSLDLGDDALLLGERRHANNQPCQESDG